MRVGLGDGSALGVARAIGRGVESMVGAVARSGGGSTIKVDPVEQAARSGPQRPNAFVYTAPAAMIAPARRTATRISATNRPRRRGRGTLLPGSMVADGTGCVMGVDYLGAGSRSDPSPTVNGAVMFR